MLQFWPATPGESPGFVSLNKPVSLSATCCVLWAYSFSGANLGKTHTQSKHHDFRIVNETKRVRSKLCSQADTCSMLLPSRQENEAYFKVRSILTDFHFPQLTSRHHRTTNPLLKYLNLWLFPEVPQHPAYSVAAQRDTQSKSYQFLGAFNIFCRDLLVLKSSEEKLRAPCLWVSGTF